MCGTPPVLSVGDMQSPATEVHDLHKSYDGQLVLRGLSFSFRAGEILGIAGPNRAGKTTTEILEGLLSRNAGDVEVLGLDPGPVPRSRDGQRSTDRVP
jgi:ABC-2 type transport system ATP-binding protein